MKYYTQIETPERKATPSGDKYLAIFQEEINKETGKKTLICIGQKNIYDMIQADLESTKIENILAAVAMGDLSVLKQQEPIYIDATTMPKNLMESQNIVLKAKQEFEKMPIEVKELFDNSAEKYVSEMGTKNFFEKMSPYNKKIAEIEKAGSMKKYQEEVKRAAQFEKDVQAAKGDNAE